jgi:hypothetical protein
MAQAWLWFWIFCLGVSAISFALITFKIAWKGVGEIRQLIRGRTDNGRDSGAGL